VSEWDGAGSHVFINWYSPAGKSCLFRIWYLWLYSASYMLWVNIWDLGCSI